MVNIKATVESLEFWGNAFCSNSTELAQNKPIGLISLSCQSDLGIPRYSETFTFTVLHGDSADFREILWQFIFITSLVNIKWEVNKSLETSAKGGQNFMTDYFLAKAMRQRQSCQYQRSKRKQNPRSHMTISFVKCCMATQSSVCKVLSVANPVPRWLATGWHCG